MVRLGKSSDQVYKIWQNMKTRCLNPRTPQFKYYGAKGIGVCKSWLVFKNFYDDMGDPPAGFSLDRINPEKGYEPKNCRWVPRGRQRMNLRTSIFLKVEGVTWHLMDFCREFGLSYRAAFCRVKRGASPKQAIRGLLDKKSKVNEQNRP